MPYLNFIWCNILVPFLARHLPSDNCKLFKKGNLIRCVNPLGHDSCPVFLSFIKMSIFCKVVILDLQSSAFIIGSLNEVRQFYHIWN